MFVLHEACSVSDTLKEYPALSRQAMVKTDLEKNIIISIPCILQIEQEMALIFEKPDIKTQFMMTLVEKYVPAILSFAEKSSKKKVKQLQHEVDKSGNALNGRNNNGNSQDSN